MLHVWGGEMRGFGAVVLAVLAGVETGWACPAANVDELEGCIANGESVVYLTGTAPYQTWDAVKITTGSVHIKPGPGGGWRPIFQGQSASQPVFQVSGSGKLTLEGVDVVSASDVFDGLILSSGESTTFVDAVTQSGALRASAGGEATLKNVRLGIGAIASTSCGAIPLGVAFSSSSSTMPLVDVLGGGKVFFDGVVADHIWAFGVAGSIARVQSQSIAAPALLIIKGDTTISCGQSAGGAVLADGASAVVRIEGPNVVFEGNHADKATFSDHVGWWSPGGTVWGFTGAALSAVNGGKLEILGGQFIDNHTAGSGGAVWVGPSSQAIVEGATFSGNHADSLGGAVAVHGGTIEIVDSDFAENDASIGGHIAVFPDGGTGIQGTTWSGRPTVLDVDRSLFVGGEATFVGGAIWVAEPRLNQRGDGWQGVRAVVRDSGFLHNVVRGPSEATDADSSGWAADFTGFGGSLAFRLVHDVRVEDSVFVREVAHVPGELIAWRNAGNTDDRLSMSRNLMCVGEGKEPWVYASRAAGDNRTSSKLVVRNAIALAGPEASSWIELAHTPADVFQSWISGGSGFPLVRKDGSGAIHMERSVIRWGTSIPEGDMDGFTMTDMFMSGHPHVRGLRASSKDALTQSPEVPDLCQSLVDATDIDDLFVARRQILAALHPRPESPLLLDGWPADLAGWVPGQPLGSLGLIGPFGGPQAFPSAWADGDDDGVPRMFDCNDGDPDRLDRRYQCEDVGGELWAWDDCELVADNFEAERTADGWTCDDLQEEEPSDGSSGSSTNDVERIFAYGQPCGCASAQSSPAWVGLGLIGIFAARRRRNA
jgi:MYXO-CTERM domain-containing protein